MYLLGRRKSSRKKQYTMQFEDACTEEIIDQEPHTEKIYKKQIDMDIGISSIIGTRNSQQDTIFGYQSGNKALAIVCDGMGGLNGGEIASQAAAESFVYAWLGKKDLSDVPAFLQEEARKADVKVFLQENENGGRLQAGTTVVAAIIYEDELYWLSVGDSKIYFIRGEEISALNREHNYRMELDMRLQQGEMTPEEYAAEEYQAEALISYIGMGNVSLMDISKQGFRLMDGDIVLLASDGLYRSLQEKDILAIVKENEKDMQRTADILTASSMEGRKVQDNTSVVILRYSETNDGEMKNDFKTM